MIVAVVDYGLGNLASAVKGFRHAGAETVLSGDPAVLRAADALVLPGDGAFGAATAAIHERGLWDLLLDFAGSGRPLLGICLGMQLLFDDSEEHGHHRGLGLLRGHVRRFEGDLVVPHMGWNTLTWERPHPLLAGLAQGCHVYFVHSYRCLAAEDVVIARSDHGGPFAAIAGRGNVLGVQFHPEKSQHVGLAMISNFVRLVVQPAASVQEAVR